MSKKALLPCLVLCLLALGLGLACDSASPVAPSGTLLSISASPNEISANGSSTIRVTALRANGTPVNPGTIVRLDTTIGSIDEQVETDEQGEARAILRGDGRIGTATVTAQSGSAEATTVEVAVGEVATSVSLQADPTSLPNSGGKIRLLASVRDDQGQPLAGATVNFTTQVGTLGSGGAFEPTDSSGQVEDILTVSQSDIASLPASLNPFQVSVQAGSGAEGATVEITVGESASSLSLQATPSSIPDAGDGHEVTLLAAVRGEQGQPLAGAQVNFTTQIGRLKSGGGFVPTNSEGQATDTLTVSESDINALPRTENAFQVGAEVGGGAEVLSTTFEVRLETVPLEADFRANPDGLTVQFTDITSNDPTSWLWSFGDQATSRDQNPTHTYTSDGTYSVTLKVTRGRSESQITKQVQVSD